MKPATALCTTVLILLTSCYGMASFVSAPKEVSISLPAETTSSLSCDFTLDQLPQAPVDSLSGFWEEGTIGLITQLPQEDVALYGLRTHDKSESLLLRSGDTLMTFDLLWLTPRCIPPQLCRGDFDGDGKQELLLLTYTGSGTGVSSWTLSILEETAEGWTALTLSDLPYETVLSPLLSCEQVGSELILSLGEISTAIPIPNFVEPGDVLEPYAGTVLSYEVEDTAITALLDVGLTRNGYGYTLYYVAQLKAKLVYNGNSFSLMEVQLSPLEE